MTGTLNKVYDVFISNAPVDKPLATDIAEALGSVGLETFHEGVLPRGKNRDEIADTIWRALAESRAMIAIITPDVPLQAMGLVEIGAAAAWNKPVFLLINGPSTTKLPPALSLYPVYPLSRLEEVIRAIQTGFDPLTDEEREKLAEIYRDLSTPTDQLSQSPKALHELTANFNRSTRKQFSGERLLSELIRMRTKGKLPRVGTRT